MPRFRSNCDDNWINIGLSEMTDEEFEDWMESDAHKKEILEHEIYRRLEQKYAGFLTEKMIRTSLHEVVKQAYRDIIHRLENEVRDASVEAFYGFMTKETIEANLSQEFLKDVKERIWVMVHQSTDALGQRFDSVESRLDQLSRNQDALMAYIKDLALRVESKG